VTPGQFQESASGKRVFFLDKDTPDNKSGKNIFIATNEHGRETVTAAKSGKIVDIGPNQFLLLGNGQQLETKSSGPKEMRVSEFDEYAARVGSNDPASRDNAPAKTKSTLTLVMDPTPVNLGELGWRLGLAFAAFNFIVIAVIVSNVNPRAGRSGNLIFALFAFVIYYNMLNIGQSWVTTGRASFAGFILALHGGVLLVAGLWLAKQHNNWSFTKVPKRLDEKAQA
jgi:lipopolysaccharide export system permease protein